MKPSKFLQKNNKFCIKMLLFIVIHSIIIFDLSRWTCAGLLSLNQHTTALKKTTLSAPVNINRPGLKNAFPRLKTLPTAFSKNLNREAYRFSAPLGIARKLYEASPPDAAKVLLDVPEEKIWLVLKKLPPEDIAKILDEFNNQEAAFFISKMNPKKAALTLNKMQKKETVLKLLSKDILSGILKTPRPLRIVHAAIEQADVFRIGGLSDVTQNLLREASEQGDMPMLIMPFWEGIDKERAKYIGDIRVPLDRDVGGQKFYLEEGIQIYMEEVGEIIKSRIYYLKNWHFDVGKDAIFTGETLVQERFILYDKAFLETLRKINFKPDIIHCHEWQAGFIPDYVEEFYRNKGIDFFNDTNVVYTAHNPAYDNWGPADKFFLTGLPKEKYFTPERSEFNGKWGFAKAALTSEAVVKCNTVSEQFAKEVQDWDYIGPYLNLYKKIYQSLAEQGKWIGIVNGGNENLRPDVNKRITRKFDKDNLDLKQIDKLELQEKLLLEQNIEKPVVGMVGRITPQKGLHLLRGILLDIVDKDAQVVLLGAVTKGDREGENENAEWQRLIDSIQYNPQFEKYKNQISINLFFEKGYPDGTYIPDLIFAGADIGVVPSLFAPCELTQMNFMWNGTPVVAYKTGGLINTVPEDIGFLFTDYTPQALKEKVFAAIDLYKNDPATWRKLQIKNMEVNFYWENPYFKYLELMYGDPKDGILALEKDTHLFFKDMLVRLPSVAKSQLILEQSI